MEPILIVLILAVLLGFLFCRWYFSHDEIVKRRMRHVPLVSIDDFPEASAGRIAGRLVYHGRPLRAPLTGRPCAHYLVKVEQYRHHGRIGSWRTLIEEERSQSFVLRDETGEALVRARRALVAVTKDAHFSSGTLNDATPRLERFLGGHGQESKGLFFNKRLRYKEGVLEEGEEVAACGFGWRRIA